MKISIRRFEEADLPFCTEIYQANRVKDFIPNGYEYAFRETLESADSLTLVITLNEQIAACGSIYLYPSENAAFLCYGLVHPLYQRQRIGSLLLVSRIAILPATPDQEIDTFLSATSHSYHFFKRHGFDFIDSERDDLGNPFYMLHMRCSYYRVYSSNQALKDMRISCPHLSIPIKAEQDAAANP